MAVVEAGCQRQQHGANAIGEHHPQGDGERGGRALRRESGQGALFSLCEGTKQHVPHIVPRRDQPVTPAWLGGAPNPGCKHRLTLGDSKKMAQITMPAAPASSSPRMPCKSGLPSPLAAVGLAPAAAALGLPGACGWAGVARCMVH